MSAIILKNEIKKMKNKEKHVPLIQNQCYRQSPRKTEINGEHERQYKYYSFLSSETNAIELFT